MPERSIDVVVVEDARPEAELILRAFQDLGLGITIRLAHDGEEALDLLKGPHQASRPRCVLLDLKLPRMSGVEVIRRIRSDPQIDTLPIVVLTSSREPRDIAECYAAGANGYVVKPIPFDEFVEAVGNIARYWLATNQPPS